MDKETEVMNQEILEMNKKLLVHNERVLLQNESMAIEEHKAKMELYSMQREKLISELSRDVEPQALMGVEVFHKLFGHPVLEEPTMPSEGRRTLRVSLIQEELDELKEAFAEDDLVAAADALADLQYVLSGTVLELGLKSKFKDIFNEVQRSNMSKACKTEQEAIATIDHYKINKNTNAYYQRVDDLFLVFREEDYKVLKSVNYSPADLQQFIKN